MSGEQAAYAANRKPTNEAHAALDDIMARRGITPATAAQMLEKGLVCHRKRVRAFKEDWISRAITAEMEVKRLAKRNDRLEKQMGLILDGLTAALHVARNLQ